MSNGFWLALVLIAGIVCGASGAQWGMQAGRNEATAARDSQAVAELSGMVNAHKGLINEAAAASRKLRAAAHKRAELDERTTLEIKDALARTESSRAGCVFPPDVMRGLAAARDRAAAASAGGAAAALPGSAAGPSNQR